VRYYGITESPYSGELYHHGIKGQKWGVRRFQNPDGTLTAAGKDRYGSGSQRFEALKSKVKSGAKVVGRAVKKAANKATKAVADQMKKRHPSLMTDEELKRNIERVAMEKKYKQALADMKADKFSSRTIAAVEDAASKSLSRFGTDVASNLAKNVTKSKSEKIKEKEAELVARQNYDNRKMEEANIDDMQLLTKFKQEERNYREKYDKATISSDKKFYKEKMDEAKRHQEVFKRRIDDRSAQLYNMNRQAERQGYNTWPNKTGQGGGNNGGQNGGSQGPSTFTMKNPRRRHSRA